METERTLSEHLEKVTFCIPIKFLSLNGYVDICRRNRYQSAKYKREIEYECELFMLHLPQFQHPVKIHFHWIEENRRRDLDNIAFAKKFILDALVKAGKLKDDSRKYVVGFQDTFGYGKETKVIVTIEEVADDTRRKNS